jgi:hypothetical protein|tara:strand:+ start:1208 stop:1321 length:114 start_codon:yes stop_codon:yes gene_type:complete
MYNLDNNPVIDGDEVINSERTNVVIERSPPVLNEEQS